MHRFLNPNSMPSRRRRTTLTPIPTRRSIAPLLLRRRWVLLTRVTALSLVSAWVSATILIMLVVIVVPRTTVISLRRPTIASLLSVSAWRRTAVALLAALSAEAGLRAVARVLLLAVGCAVTSLLRSAVLSLAGCGRGVAAVAWLLAAGVVGRWGRGAGIGAAGCGGGVVAVAVVAAAGGLVVRSASHDASEQSTKTTARRAVA